MFIRKSRYIALNDHLDELEEQNEQLEEQNEQLEEQLKQKNMNNLVELLDSEEYRYAILVKNYVPIVYNNGRIEKDVRSIKFETQLGNIPILTIEKQ